MFIKLKTHSNPVSTSPPLVWRKSEPTRVWPFVLRNISVRPLTLEISLSFRVVFHNPEFSSIFHVMFPTLVENFSFIGRQRTPVNLILSLTFEKISSKKKFRKFPIFFHFENQYTGIDSFGNSETGISQTGVTAQDMFPTVKFVIFKV